MTDLGASADYYRYFARESKNGGSPLYERFSLAFAEDPALMTLSAGRRKEQPPANIVFAAVHALLLSGTDHPLKAYYPSIGGTRPADDEAVLHLRDFVHTHADRLLPLIASGVTNTNEVGRSAFLAPALCVVARRAARPLAIIEIGPSAGLNLNFDRFGYCYQMEETGAEHRFWPGEGLLLTSRARGALVPPMLQAPPEVASRLGLELNPNDLADPARRLWLKALVWPERVDRLAKLERGIEIALRHPPPIRFGDALALLPGAIADAPASAALVIVHSFVLYQFSSDMRAELERSLVSASLSRTVARIGVEGTPDGRYPLEMTLYEGGTSRVELLAHADPHGLWVSWEQPHDA